MRRNLFNAFVKEFNINPELFLVEAKEITSIKVKRLNEEILQCVSYKDENDNKDFIVIHNDGTTTLVGWEETLIDHVSQGCIVLERRYEFLYGEETYDFIIHKAPKGATVQEMIERDKEICKREVKRLSDRVKV